jgi:hypothetical protein
MMETKIPLDQAREECQAALATGKGLEDADAAWRGRIGAALGILS